MPLFITITSLAMTRPGLIVERKSASAALHYRLAPELEPLVLEFAAAIAERHSRFSLLRGKCVVEIKSGQRTKGDALTDFMRIAPFAGRRPVMAGDDVTDEAAFAAANAMGGISIKIGPGESIAPFRFDTPDRLHAHMDWLATHWLAQEGLGGNIQARDRL